ncbi:unnamed protein product [Candidula unifasciata]|uniref:IRS-type PTB domain-containing protein n=1 Tax=Candidula unifasciata TaxID=100452 RepID=A0A8S3ZMF5_9EUPU|nr:unnamed protein product [Candidula unifasciata]
MADATVIVEGKIKFRDGKKWKPRWCILKKPSPVADRLQVYLYKDLTEFTKNESKPKSVFALDGFFGLDAGFAYDREPHVLALICHKSISLMAFELRENMIQFEIKIRQNMGEEHQFPVKVVKAPSSARLPKDPVRLMIHSMRFCLIAHVPPKILIAWNIEDLRRFGTREGKFCFEGGTRCGKGSGVFALQSEQAEDIADIVNLASTGKLVNCHRKFRNRRRLSQVASYEMPDEINYSSVTVYVDTVHDDDDDDAIQSDASPAACTLSHHIVNASDISDCVNPAKSILRPRSGQEYLFIQRIFLTSPVIFSCLPTNSSFVNSVFSELQKPHEELFLSYQTDPPSAIPSQSIPSHYLSLPHNTPQKSPSTSSGKETVRSSVSVHSPFWGPDPSHHRCEGRSHAKCDTSSLASTPYPVFSPHHGLSDSPIKSKSAHAAGTEDSIFFPMYMTFSATTPPPSPLGPYTHTCSAQHTPTYVNQEFVNRHNNASASGHTVSTSGSFSTNSPIRAGMQSLKSLIFKDSSRNSPRVSKETRTQSRHSESDANKIEKLSLSLPSSKHNESSASSSVQRSHSDPKRSDADEKLQLPPGTVSSYRELPQKVYDKFADSSIISRRRRRHVAGNKLTGEAALVHISAEPSLKDISREHSPILKSTGYKNIDCINAATSAAISSPSPRTPSVGPDTLHLGHTSQLGSILESRISPHEIIHSPGSLVFVTRNRHSSSFVFNGGGPDTVQHSVTIPSSSSPAPLLPSREKIPSSPSSSCSLNSAISSSDVSDSPPSYFAPSPPPHTPPPPELPPRLPLPAPDVMISSSPIKPDTVSHLSFVTQQLNYIEVDTTKPAETVVLAAPLANSRRSKRVRQQKEKDYAKLRYAVIDHQATKALQQARQEHEQCRDSSLRHIQPKDAHLDRASHLSRINSAPASSKRKQISIMQRERKLSSGSIETC